MVNNFRKYSALAMLGLFVMQIVLSVSTHFFIEQNREVQKERIANCSSHLETILLSKKEFAQSYVEAKNELQWNNNFYDISSVKLVNGYYEVTVLADMKEKTLQNIAKKQANKTGHKPSTMKLLNDLVYIQHKEIQYDYCDSVVGNLYSSFYLIWKGIPYFKIASPPPDLC